MRSAFLRLRRHDMGRNSYIGEFEQMILLAILQGGEDANAYQVRLELEGSAGRTVSKGAFYTTLDRLEKKGWVSWESRPPTVDRGGLPQRHFRVTPEGIVELQRSRAALQKLWRGLDTVLAPGG